MRAGFVDRMSTGGAPGAGVGAVPAPVPVPDADADADVGPVADAGEGENDEAGEGGVEVIVLGTPGYSRPWIRIRLGNQDKGSREWD